MKSITIPDPVTIPAKTGRAEATVSFYQFVEHAIDQFPEFQKPVSSLYQAGKILNAVETANGSVMLEGADYTKLKKAVDARAQIPSIARYEKPFYEAIDNAEETVINTDVDVSEKKDESKST